MSKRVAMEQPTDEDVVHVTIVQVTEGGEVYFSVGNVTAEEHALLCSMVESCPSQRERQVADATPTGNVLCKVYTYTEGCEEECFTPGTVFCEMDAYQVALAHTPTCVIMWFLSE